MAFDSQRGRTVLFGGKDDSSPFGDTWEWDGSTWTQVATTGPSPRFAHAIVYDSQRARTVLFGGYFILGDTWEWNGSIWTQVATTGPLGRHSHAMAYDSRRGRTVLFGGAYYSGIILADTWEWNGSTWTQVAIFAGATARFGHEMAYDGQRGSTLLFGGQYGNSTSFHDTWEWDGGLWTQVATTGPSARLWHSMVYDSQRERTVLFGGLGDFGLLGDTWELSFPGTAATFGTGCGTPALVLSPIGNARPTINTTAQASLTNIPSTLAFVALGWSRTSFGPFPLPLTLAAFGMPGCDLLHSSEAAGLTTTSTGPGTATFSLRLPNIAGMIGLHVYLQSWALAPNANAANTIVSNGIDWGIGNS